MSVTEYYEFFKTQVNSVHENVLAREHCYFVVHFFRTINAKLKKKKTPVFSQ